MGLAIYSPIPSVTISTANGKLFINNTGKVAFANGNEPNSPHNLLIADTKCDAVITVENSSKLVIGADQSAKHGQLRISDGSTLHIKTGGTLHITSSQSMLWIKSGATLILDAGAIVNLESPESKILIEGTLVINGDIDFQGYGYFDFGNGNKLEFGPGIDRFRLDGRGIGNRFVRLSNDLDIETGHGVYWTNGKMESLYGSLLINENGHCHFTDMEVVGGGSSDDYKAIAADGAEFLVFTYSIFKETGTAVSSKNSGLHNFVQCDFSDMKKAIEVEGGDGAFFIVNCTFEQYHQSAVIISDRSSLTVSGSNWEGADQTFGLDLLRVTHVTLRNSNLNNHGIPTGAFNSTEVNSAAVILDGVSYFIMRNSGMSNNDVGINALPVFSFPSNVFMLEGSFIQNSKAGINMIGDGTIGLVLMDCASLLNNEFGIFGTDVILMIDAINAQQHPLDGNEPNSFLRSAFQGGDSYFSICYALAPAMPVLMRKNWWAVNDVNTQQLSPQSFMTLVFSPTCSTPVSLDVSQALDRAPTDCNPEEFAGPTYPGTGVEAECNVNVIGEIAVLGEAWHTAYQQLRLENFEAAETGFQPIADLWSSNLSAYSSNCQQYIQVARAIVDGAGQGGVPRSKEVKHPALNERSSVSINPNPSAGLVNIVLPEIVCTVRIWDTYGKLIHETSASGLYRLNVSTWQGGLYFIDVKTNDSSFSTTLKMIVQI